MSEQTLRRKAYQLGYQLKKDYMRYMAFSGSIVEPKRVGYMVLDLKTDTYVWGSYNNLFQYLWDLEDVEAFLREKDTEKIYFRGGK